MKTYKLVQNDTKPRLNFTITQDGDPVDLTGATVRFKMKQFGASEVKVNGTCTIVDAEQGTCYYDWSSGDLDTIGLFIGELEITFVDSSVQSSREVMKFEVRDDF